MIAMEINRREFLEIISGTMITLSFMNTGIINPISRYYPRDECFHFRKTTPVEHVTSKIKLQLIDHLTYHMNKSLAELGISEQNKGFIESEYLYLDPVNLPDDPLGQRAAGRMNWWVPRTWVAPNRIDNV